jgi:rod shape-determining protein MreC
MSRRDAPSGAQASSGLGLRSRSLILGALALVIVAGLILDELGALAPLEGIFLQLLRPVQRLTSGLTGRVVDANRTLRRARDLQTRNEQLESLVDQLMVENVRLKEFEAQNEDLREKLNFAETHPEYILRAAQVKGRVIASEPNNLLSILIIDVGRRHGIEKGMPVVTERGLVGHIQTIGTNWAKVLLINDPSSSVTALIQASRAQGVVAGRLAQDMIMDYIPQDQAVAVGDIVLTSGMGGNYPKALVIGQVVEVERRDIDAFQRAVVHPSVNFERLETVLVITSFDPVDVAGAIDSSRQQDADQEQDSSPSTSAQDSESGTQAQPEQTPSSTPAADR